VTLQTRLLEIFRLFRWGDERTAKCAQTVSGASGNYEIAIYIILKML
jgi:hypothetical protein